MFEDRPMPSGPEDQLERRLAAEEAAIHDDGFTQRIMDRAEIDLLRRRTAIYGAGLAGLGFAVGGLMEMGPHLSGIMAWIDGWLGGLTAANLQQTVQSASDATQLAVVAVLAGFTFLITAVSLHNR